jgi:hypothetical protein
MTEGRHATKSDTDILIGLTVNDHLRNDIDIGVLEYF